MVVWLEQAIIFVMWMLAANLSNICIYMVIYTFQCHDLLINRERTFESKYLPEFAKEKYEYFCCIGFIPVLLYSKSCHRVDPGAKLWSFKWCLTASCRICRYLFESSGAYEYFVALFLWRLFCCWNVNGLGDHNEIWMECSKFIARKSQTSEELGWNQECSLFPFQIGLSLAASLC